MRGRNRNIFYFILLAGLLAIIWASYKSFNTVAPPSERSTYDLIQAADQNKVKDDTIKSNGTEVIWNSTDGGHYKTTIRDTFQDNTKLVEDTGNFSTGIHSSTTLQLCHCMTIFT